MYNNFSNKMNLESEKISFYPYITTTSRIYKNNDGDNKDAWNNYDAFNMPEFEKYQEDRRDENRLFNKQRTLTRGTITGVEDRDNTDELTKNFFSDKNIKKIQKMIKSEIPKRTKNVFKLDVDQDESDLLVVMRAVFYDNARFLPNRLDSQINELNNKVIEYIVPDMITNIKQSYAYLQEINQPIKPIDRPINVNNAGRRTLPSLTNSYGF